MPHGLTLSRPLNQNGPVQVLTIPADLIDTVTPRALAVYARLRVQGHLDEDGALLRPRASWPTLGRLTGLDRRTVRDALGELSRRGWVR